MRRPRTAMTIRMMLLLVLCSAVYLWVFQTYLDHGGTVAKARALRFGRTSARRAAARDLADQGFQSGPEAFRALIAALDDPDGEVRLLAAVALKSFGEADPDAALGLVRLLRDRDPKLRAAAAEALGTQPLPGVTRALVAALDDPDCRVVVEVVGSLAKLRTTDGLAIDRLLTRTEAPDPAIRAASLASLSSLGQVAGGAGAGPDFSPSRAYQTALQRSLKDPLPSVRLAALRSLQLRPLSGFHDPAAVIAALAEAIRSADPIEQVEAAHGLVGLMSQSVQLGDKQEIRASLHALPPLLEELRRPEDRRRDAALSALTRVGITARVLSMAPPPRLRDQIASRIEEALTDPRAETRAAAQTALIEFGPRVSLAGPSTLRALEAGLADRDPRVRRSVIAGLAGLRHQEELDWRVARDLLRSLGLLATRTFFKEAREANAARDWAAGNARALGRRLDPENLQLLKFSDVLLIRALNDPESDVRLRAFTTLRRTERPSKEVEDALAREVRNRLKRLDSPDPRVREEAARGFAWVRREEMEEVWAALRKHLDDPDPKTAQKVAQSVQKLNHLASRAKNAPEWPRPEWPADTDPPL